MTRAAPAGHVAQQGFTVHTRGRGFSEITDKVTEAVMASGVHTGIAHVFTTHTSCSLLISENADPAVRDDLERWFARAVPDGDAIFRHEDERSTCGRDPVLENFKTQSAVLRTQRSFHSPVPV